MNDDDIRHQIGRTDTYVAEDVKALLDIRIHHMIGEAEVLYGKRDPRFTLHGMRFVDNTQNIYYPSECEVIIQIPFIYYNDYVKCLYCTAHESYHCISPNFRAMPPNRLEEGLATLFAKQYMSMIKRGEGWHTGCKNYDTAMDDVQELLNIDLDVIKKVRAIVPHSTSLITADDLAQVIIDPAHRPLLDRLEAKFVY